ncbi:A24 family peptidase [Pseudacidovorax intermedius]|uniref:Prepilin leader peptidase/N-methyltransferase n=1 Tax=Pseudacidovorax intermedius TaxID=433924 RepID=A0A147GV08_9BURK|nr:A24 family peptidase [Pseudacidovorax intermedius]KTT21395.1 peptidase A24 [Pseudacidovorax intermedius]
MGSAALDAGLAGLVGLLIGSFLNVVIHRLPRMMYRGWLVDATANLAPQPGLPSLWSLVFGPGSAPPGRLEQEAEAALAQVDALPAYDLARPRSRCGHCGHGIRWYENIPVLSWLVLRGRCSACRAPIGIRYPLVELATGALFALCGWRFGLSLTGVLWAAFCALLVCQFVIDLDTQLLPDSLNYLLLWLGLGGAAFGLTGVAPASAILGAVFGYLSLWVVYQLYRAATGREGMGYGDFKLLAALGAWLGASYLLALILVSSLVGAVLGVALVLGGRLANRHVPISFGPFLAGAGLLCLVAGPAAVRAWLPFAFPLGL